MTDEPPPPAQLGPLPRYVAWDGKIYGGRHPKAGSLRRTVAGGYQELLGGRQHQAPPTPVPLPPTPLQPGAQPPVVT